MQKKIMLCLIVLFACQQADAQGKQIQNLVQQIAELQVYIGYLKKGYDIVQTGIHTVRDIRKGEFNLHSLYYGSLKTLNPKIWQSAQAMGTVSNLQYVVKYVTFLKKTIRVNNMLSEEQRQFILQCCYNLMEDVAGSSQSLSNIISSGTLQMSDDERINRVNTIYKKSIDQSVFIQQLLSQTIALLRSQKQDQVDDERLKSFYDIK